ncbi:MAG: zinc ribbon domain-containing protein [Candidatus Thermoplasmatota archaeon]|nr:zinc ribbon domain-containing protein [Poseidonia sp.]MEC7089477.1 zinc ribbon domain-containing protein [Candidatus Thermoplasmatota archaeon]MEC8415890.1 zinc ribbon domain-containing protein [Candidatus Thermoplasmatota archaeon]MEC8707944.1 zinc ribbon domain-containing protein [Candidatus Thermoplasmatota archaeon]MEC8766030.1 zinc ribbon domain-containing protein [Candidatus Thermoplasmatota archaeon]
MGFCINCGQQHPDGTRFCRFCGNQQPGEQLLQRLRVEAQQIHNMRVQMQSQPQQGNPYQQRRW